MLVEQLKLLIQPEVDDLGFILWGVEVDGSEDRLGEMTVRVYIDYEEGISVDDCQQVSKAVSAIFDVEDPIKSSYVLEVSSPGVNRRVFNSIQAESLVGFTVKTKLVRAVEGNRRKFKGVIKSVYNGVVTLETDIGDICFDFDAVEKMRVTAQF